jgi:hypothetical protein
VLAETADRPLPTTERETITIAVCDSDADAYASAHEEEGADEHAEQLPDDEEEMEWNPIDLGEAYGEPCTHPYLLTLCRFDASAADQFV